MLCVRGSCDVCNMFCSKEVEHRSQNTSFRLLSGRAHGKLDVGCSELGHYTAKGKGTHRGGKIYSSGGSEDSDNLFS